MTHRHKLPCFILYACHNLFYFMCVYLVCLDFKSRCRWYEILLCVGVVLWTMAYYYIFQSVFLEMPILNDALSNKESVVKFKLGKYYILWVLKIQRFVNLWTFSLLLYLQVLNSHNLCTFYVILLFKFLIYFIKLIKLIISSMTKWWFDSARVLFDIKPEVICPIISLPSSLVYLFS